MKFEFNPICLDIDIVAPCVGAWIEILLAFVFHHKRSVAPCVGAWIEIRETFSSVLSVPSLLAWERGLKYSRFYFFRRSICRSLRGSVD